jgi:hydrogenase maturation protease
VVVCVAMGNSLRGDDGVAQRALQLIAPGGYVRLRQVCQLTPELAAEIAITGADTVFFLDADPSSTETTLEPVETRSTRGTPLAHSMSPAEVLELTRRLYGFAGEAFLCRIPAKYFEHGERLSPQAEAGAHAAAKMIQERIAGRFTIS